MPFLLLPMLAGSLGFVGGVKTADSTSNLAKWLALGGAAYVAYKLKTGAIKL